MKKVLYYLGAFMVLRSLTLVAYNLHSEYIDAISQSYSMRLPEYFLKNTALLLIGIALGINYVLEQKCKFLSFERINVSKLIILGIPYLFMVYDEFFIYYMSLILTFICKKPINIYHPFLHNPADGTIAPIILGVIIISSIKKSLFTHNKKIITE